MIKAIFFDFDGTISETRNIVEKTFFEVLDRFDFDYEKKEIRRFLGIKTEEFFKKISVDKKLIKKLKKVFYNKLLEELYLRDIALCSPVKPLFDLKKKYILIVVSNNESLFLRAAIKKLKLEKLFNGVYGADSFSSKDKMLKKLFKKYGIKPEEAIYVGDRFSDIVYAKKAGCYSVAIHNSCSWSSLKEIKAKSPDFIVSNFKDIKKVIKKITKIRLVN